MLGAVHAPKDLQSFSVKRLRPVPLVKDRKNAPKLSQYPRNFRMIFAEDPPKNMQLRVIEIDRLVVPRLPRDKIREVFENVRNPQIVVAEKMPKTSERLF